MNFMFIDYYKPYFFSWKCECIYFATILVIPQVTIPEAIFSIIGN